MSDRVAYRCSEVAKLLGCSDRAVRKAVVAGHIPAERIGAVWFIPRWWVDRHRVAPDQRAGVVAAPDRVPVGGR